MINNIIFFINKNFENIFLSNLIPSQTSHCNFVHKKPWYPSGIRSALTIFYGKPKNMNWYEPARLFHVREGFGGKS